MNLRRLLAFAIAVALIVLAVGIIFLKSSGSDQITIALNVPLTGPVAAWSGQYANGFNFGIEDACKEHGIDPSIFRVDSQDNQGKPDIAVSVFRSQQQRGFDIYVTAAAGPVNAVTPLVDETGKPHFIASFDTTITRSSKSRFRLMANSRLEVPLFIDLVRKKEAKSVHFIYLNYPNLESQYSDFLEPELSNLGVAVSRDVFEMDARDFRLLVERASTKNADLIFAMGFSFHLQPLLEQLQLKGLAEQGRVVANMDAVDLLATGENKAILKGVVFTCPYFDIPGKAEKAASWRERYEARFGQIPTYVPAYAYDNAVLVVKAFKESGRVDAAALSNAVPFLGINGEIDFDQYRDIKATVGLVELFNGVVKEVKDVKPLTTQLKKAG
ncbi:MAG: ABC transporter substrate-binding protein [Pirellulaceae bacterium]